MSSKLKFKIENSNRISRHEVADTKAIIKSLEKLIRNSMEENPDLELETILDTINNIVNDYLYDLKSPTKGDLYLFKTIQDLTKHPQLISDTLYKMDTSFLSENNTENITYISDIQKNYETAIKDCLSAMYEKLTEAEKEKIINKTFTPDELKLFQNKIKKFLEFFYDKKFNSIIKDGYVHRIVNYTEILDFIGVLQQNNQINNKKLKYANLEFLGFHYRKNPNDTIKRPCISDLMDKEFVKNFSIDELTALSTFYSNRVAKGIKSYNYALYTFYKANIIEKYFEDKNYTFDLSNEEITNFIKQYQILRVSARNFLDSIEKNGDTKDYKITDNTVYEEQDNYFIQKALNLFGGDYSKEFSKILPKYEHDFLKDLNKTIMLESGSYNTYKTKDHSLEALLFILLEKNKEINWGIVLNDYVHGLPNQNQSNNLLLCVDMKEFNMPLTLHCSKRQIKEFLKNYTGKTYLPVYKGNEDMFVDDELISTQIYMKLSKDQRKLLRQKAEKISARQSMYYKFVKHLQWISHPKRPPEFIDSQNLIYDLNTDFLYDENDLENEQR